MHARVGAVSIAETPELRLERWYRPVAVGLTAFAIALMAFELYVVVPHMPAPAFGVDFHQYQNHARRWLAGGGFYLSAQLDGPYHVFELLPPLYPPPILVLLVPFLSLPWALWWVIPLTIVAAVVWHHRPAPWTWPVIAALAAWPRTYEAVLFGNPVMWIAAAVALGTVWGWPFVGVLLKPSLVPFAFIGVRRREWWIAAAAALVVSAVFGAMWLDYARALLNADVTWSYSVREIPMLMLPIVAWLGRQTPRDRLPRRDDR